MSTTAHPITGGLALVFVFLLAPFGALAQEADPAPAPLSPEEAVSAALLTHPTVVEAESAHRIARAARSTSALLLDNPEGMVSWMPAESRAEIELIQPLSLTGEGWFARAAAASNVEVATAGLRHAKMKVAAQTRHAWIAAAVAVAQRAVATEGLDQAVRLRGAATRRHEEGEAPLLDMRLARLAHVKAATTLLDARAAEAKGLASLAAMIGRPVTAGALTASPLTAAPPPSETLPPERADITAARAAVRAAERGLSRERAATLPALGLGAMIEVDPAGTLAGPALEIELPLFDRNQGGRASATGEVAVATATLTTLEARATVEQATARERDREATALSTALGEDLLAEARETLVSIEAGYLAGELDLPQTVLLHTEVLDGEAAVIAFEGSVARTRVDLLLATEDEALLTGGAR